MAQGERLQAQRALLVAEGLAAETGTARAARALVAELAGRGVEVLTSPSPADGAAIVVADSSLQCIVLEWGPDDLPDGTPDSALTGHAGAAHVIEAVRSRNAQLPIFLITSREPATRLTPAEARQVDELIFLLEDTPPFIAGRILAAMARYREAIMPPLNKALMAFADVSEYSWHTPGHAGGVAFLKSPVGRAFHAYFGEPLLRSDLSVAVGALGSLFDHSGPIGESERYAARVFGAHRTYSVTNGTSTSNRVVFMASVTAGDLALIDRNCHKSLVQSLTLTGAIHTYLVPSRNYLGIVGPIYPQRLSPEGIAAAIAVNPLAEGAVSGEPVHAVITNSTYDGLCYRATRVLDLLGRSVDRVHFDEAWFGYAPFNPLYAERCGLSGDPAAYPSDAPTLFTVTSTHKLLAALSQASFIHVRDGRRPVPHGRFNESFMMHASTSPQYAILASNEVSAAMMDGPGGRALTTESIAEAVAFRQAVRRIRRSYAGSGEWFFSTWNADEVEDPATGRRVPFEDAPAELLIADPACWVLRPGDTWHGFPDLEDGYCLLDPIKVSVVAPGVRPDGSFAEQGIPAALVTAYLGYRGTLVEKTADFTVLFLFSLGVTKGKWGTLVSALLRFKEDYDANTPLTQALPALVAAHPTRYGPLGLRDLADEMFLQVQRSHQLQLQARAFSGLPRPVMTPTRAYQHLVRGEVEQVSLDNLAGRVVATAVVPYPPGIPMLMPGEEAGAEDGPHVGYLKAMQDFDRRFPGFEHETHGVEKRDGAYFLYCLT